MSDGLHYQTQPMDRDGTVSGYVSLHLDNHLNIESSCWMDNSNKKVLNGVGKQL